MTTPQIAIRAALIAAAAALAAIVIETPGAAGAVAAGEPSLYAPAAAPVVRTDVATFTLPRITVVAKRMTAEEIAAARAQDHVVASAE